MHAQVGPSFFQPQDQEDGPPGPGSVCHVDDATQTITGDFEQDLVESKHSLPLRDDTSICGVDASVSLPRSCLQSWMHSSAVLLLKCRLMMFPCVS